MSKKFGFLTENTIFFVMQGTKVFYFKDYEIKVDSSHGVLLKKGIYAMSRSADDFCAGSIFKTIQRYEGQANFRAG